jgi:hypothetical protein
MSSTTKLRGRWRRALVGTAIVVMVGGSAASVMAANSPAAIQPEGIVTPTQVEVFVSLTPSRILDTRGPASGGPIGVPTATPLQPGQQLDLTVSGPGKAVPAGATAAVLNTTIDYDATLHSFLTIWPTGQPRPISSTNNALPGSEVSNLTVARLGTGGAISIYNQQGEVNLVLDVVGYLVPLNQVTGFESGLNTVRNGTGAPSDAIGNDGDFYVDTATHQLYGPKTGGHWANTPTSLVGPAGTPGTPGTPGIQGVHGDAGGLVAAISAYNNTPALITTLIAGFTPLPFPVPGALVGTNIAQTNPTTFTVGAAGTYQISYRITSPVAGVAATVTVQRTGFPVGPSPIAFAETSVADTILVTANAGDTFQVGVNGAVGLGLTYTGDIAIEQIAPGVPT